MAIEFFKPTDELTGIPSDWVLQSHSPSFTINRAQGLKDNGDEAASKIYGRSMSDTFVYKAFTDTGTIPIGGDNITAGYVSGDWHVDSISIKYSATDYPEISVTVHKHVDCEPNVKSHDSDHRKVKDTLLTLPYGFGCPATLRDIVGVSTTDTEIGMTSFTYELSVTHQDETGGSGGYLASDNRDGVETISIELTGVPSAEPSVSGWDLTANSSNESNTTANTASYTLTRHVAAVAGA